MQSKNLFAWSFITSSLFAWHFSTFTSRNTKEKKIPTPMTLRWFSHLNELQNGLGVISLYGLDGFLYK